MGRITYFLLTAIILHTAGFAEETALFTSSDRISVVDSSLAGNRKLTDEVNKVEEPEYEEDIRILSAECLQLFESHRGFGGNHQLRFYNTCPHSVWASVCIEERPGQFKQHDSASRIPKYGYWNIYTYETSTPVSVNWRSGRAKQPPPGPCGGVE